MKQFRAIAIAAIATAIDPNTTTGFKLFKVFKKITGLIKTAQKMTQNIDFGSSD